MLVVNNRINVPLKEFEFTYARSQGPGGQNVNKVNSKATLRWSVANNRSLPEPVRARFLEQYKRRITLEGDLLITSQRFRDRGRNVADCLSKLRDLIELVAVAPKKRRPTRPTKGSVKRRRRSKEVNSQKKQYRKPPSIEG